MNCPHDQTPEELRGVEDALRGQPLRRPSARLDERIASLRAASTPVERADEVRVRRSRSTWGRWLVGVSLATVLLIAAWSTWQGFGPQVAQDRHKDQPPAPPVNGPGAPDPIQIERQWSSVTVNEVVLGDDGRPMQRLVRRSLRQFEVIDEAGEVHIQWTVPSEESFLVPLGS